MKTSLMLIMVGFWLTVYSTVKAEQAQSQFTVSITIVATCASTVNTQGQVSSTCTPKTYQSMTITKPTAEQAAIINQYTDSKNIKVVSITY